MVISSFLATGQVLAYLSKLSPDAAAALLSKATSTKEPPLHEDLEASQRQNIWKSCRSCSFWLDVGHGEAPVGEDAAEVAAFVMRALAAGAMICVDMFHVYRLYLSFSNSTLCGAMREGNIAGAERFWQKADLNFLGEADLAASSLSCLHRHLAVMQPFPAVLSTTGNVSRCLRTIE